MNHQRHKKRRRKSLWVKYAFVWLGIFVVGSLIVNFLVTPGSFQSFKYNIESTTQDIVDSFKEKPKIDILEQQVEENIEEINTKISCFQIEIGADYYSWVSDEDLKEQECKTQCAQRIMKYSDFKCEDDELYCYCIKNQKGGIK